MLFKMVSRYQLQLVHIHIMLYGTHTTPHWDSVFHGQFCFYFVFRAESVSYMVLVYNLIHKKAVLSGTLTSSEV